MGGSGLDYEFATHSAARSLGLAMDGLGEYGADVAPDGKHIAFTAGDSSVEVWVLEGVAVPRAHR